MMIGASSSSHSRASGLMKFMLPLALIIPGKGAGGKGKRARGERRWGLAAVEGWAPTPGLICRSLDRNHVGRLAALGALDHFEADRLPLAQGAVALFLDRRIVHKDVDAVTDVNEAVSFSGVKPFDLTFGHNEPPLA